MAPSPSYPIAPALGPQVQRRQPHPEVVLAPPEGFEPPEDMPPRMTGDPEADAGAMLVTFFQLMDADGSGAIDFEEF